MAQPVKFTFDAVFEVEDDHGEHGEPLGGYTRQELEAAREQASQAGFAEGVAQERATAERQQSDALATIAANLKDIAQTQAAELERTVRTAAGLSLAIARKLVPELMKRQPLAEVESLIAEHLGELIDEPRVVVRVHDDMLDVLKTRIDDIAAGCGFSGRVVLLADQALAVGDCRIEWADGGVERDTEAVWRELEARIALLTQVSTEVEGDTRAADPAIADAPADTATAEATVTETTMETGAADAASEQPTELGVQNVG